MKEKTLPNYSLDEMREWFGFGVAGNFAGHLDQAGEAVDFASVKTKSPDVPKGIFPIYVPGDEGFLGDFPLSNDRILAPADDPKARLQPEPEVGVVCRVSYDKDGGVKALHPEAIAAFNDCSIRRPGAKKISEKKNWGSCSKGIATQFIPIENLEADGPTANLRLGSYLIRDGQVHSYGINSPLGEYSYYGTQLLDWICERLENQTGSPDTPLEPVGAFLKQAGCPPRVLIGIGATRYTPFGESNFLAEGDDSVVVIYDSSLNTEEEVIDALARRDDSSLTGASVLRQAVVIGS